MGWGEGGGERGEGAGLLAQRGREWAREYRSKRKPSSEISTIGSIGRGEWMPGMSDIETRCNGAPHATIMSEIAATKVRILKTIGNEGVQRAANAGKRVKKRHKGGLRCEGAASRELPRARQKEELQERCELARRVGEKFTDVGV